MDTIIIGQGYNLREDTSVGKELIEQFNSHRYTDFTCLVAFASYGGISAMTPYIKEAKENGVNIKVILGVDQKGTSKEALEEVLSWGVDAKIYHTQAMNIFHPKVYLFENQDIFTMIVGSNNLTEMGLVKNIECSLLIKDIKSNPVHKDFYKYWRSILDGSEMNLYKITQDFIDKLYKDGIVTSEHQRVKRYDNGRDEADAPSGKELSFNDTPIQRNPQGFKPKRLIKAKNPSSASASCTTQGSNSTDVSIPIDEQVLIAEIGGGGRWKQINFPVSIFENFFGAQRGNNSYIIRLTNVALDGSLGEIEERPAVSVASKNYRFEVNCAETNGAYPTGEDRPIGIFVKRTDCEFLYQILLPKYSIYNRIKNYLYEETKNNNRELKRAIVHVEAIHALYPELII